MATGEVAIDINDGLVGKIKQYLKDLPGSPMEVEKFTIFRVPTCIREKKKELYEPRIVSIGPYYHGKESFKAMEKHKWRYLRDFLSRNTQNNIEYYVNELRKSELLLRARRCYFEDFEPIDEEFVMMLLLDGCFIIEFLIKWYDKVPDPVFDDVGWTLPFIMSDFLMLENQIPFFVIERLFDLVKSGSRNRSCPKVSLIDLLRNYLLDEKEKQPTLIITGEIQHMLHLYHLCYLSPPNPNNLTSTASSLLTWLNPKTFVFVLFSCICKVSSIFRSHEQTKRSHRTIPSATELQEAGMTLRRKKSDNILDVAFRKGILEIPFISIDDTKKALLTNLITFEQCYDKVQRNLTSYACFMGFIVKTPRDVKALQERGILENLLASDEELVKFFNGLNDCTSLDYEEEHYLADLFTKVNKYYESDRHRWRAKLKRDYFNSPWAIISFAAGVILLSLAILQAVYRIYTYYHH